MEAPHLDAAHCSSFVLESLSSFALVDTSTPIPKGLAIVSTFAVASAPTLDPTPLIDSHGKVRDAGSRLRKLLVFLATVVASLRSGHRPRGIVIGFAQRVRLEQRDLPFALSLRLSLRL